MADLVLTGFVPQCTPGCPPPPEASPDRSSNSRRKRQLPLTKNPHMDLARSICVDYGAGGCSAINYSYTDSPWKLFA